MATSRRSSKTATPAADSTPAQSAGHVPAFARTRAATPAQSGILDLPGPRAAWTWYASPWDLGVYRGHFRPLLKKARFAPGENGNALSHHFGQGWGQWLRDQGYIEIPHTIETVAWGEPHAGEKSNYLCEWKRRSPDGNTVFFSYFEHAWRKPIQTPAGLRWEDDAEGLLDFYDRAVAHIAPGGLSDEQIRAAVAPAIAAARNLLDRDNPRGRRLLVEQIQHIPEEHRPLDLRQALARIEAEAASLAI